MEGKYQLQSNNNKGKKNKIIGSLEYIIMLKRTIISIVEILMRIQHSHTRKEKEKYEH